MKDGRPAKSVLMVAALGVVFGDIGTSPLYAFKECLSPAHGVALDRGAVLGMLSLVINLMGFWGGLVMSAIKRDRGIKDWGHMIEGHGGMLDRLDSVCFAAPVFFHLVRYFWNG